MTHEEYLKKIKDLNREFGEKKTSIMKSYVDANNKYKIGDTVTDHLGSIKVEKISYHWGLYDKPCAVFYGSELKKDGTVKKLGGKRNLYQSNIKE